MLVLTSAAKQMKFHSSTLLCLSKFESLHEEKLSTHRHEAQSKAWALRFVCCAVCIWCGEKLDLGAQFFDDSGFDLDGWP